MKFETGKSGNPKGRSVGSKNIKTEQWEQLGTFIIEKGAERAIRILDEMGDELYLDAYTKLLGYFKPKLKAVDNKTDNTGNIIIDLGGGLVEPITGVRIINDETPFERIRRVNNLEPEKKEDPPTPILKQKKDVKPIEDISKPSDADTTGSDNRNNNTSGGKDHYGQYIIMT